MQMAEGESELDQTYVIQKGGTDEDFADYPQRNDEEESKYYDKELFKLKKTVIPLQISNWAFNIVLTPFNFPLSVFNPFISPNRKMFLPTFWISIGLLRSR